MSRHRLAVCTAVLLVIALVVWGSIRYAENERAYQHDLLVMRSAIDQYTLERQSPPRTLSDLAAAGYFQPDSVNDKYLLKLFRKAAAEH